jgi:hypothetical protein
MAYGNDPAGDVNDEVRFLCGDTSASPFLNDDEIEYLLAAHGTAIRAAYHGALAIVAKLTAKGRIAIGTAEKDYGTIAQQFRDVAASLAERGGAAGVSNGKGVAPWAGGLVGSTRDDGSTVVLETDVNWAGAEGYNEDETLSPS